MKQIEYGSANKHYIAYMENLDQILAHDPNNFTALLKKGILSFCPFYRTDEAEKIFDRLVHDYPTNVDVYFWYGECLLGYAGEYEKAEVMLRTALTLDPNRADCHKVLGSVISAFDNNLPEAEYHYKQAIKLEPTWPLPRKGLAYVLYKQGKFKEALAQIEEALPYCLENFEYENDPIPYRYEELITGRIRNDLKATLLNLKEKINNELHHKDR